MTRLCAIVACQNQAYRRSLCRKHWRRYERGLPMVGPTKVRIASCRICGATWCLLPGAARRRLCGSPSCRARAGGRPRANISRDAAVVAAALTGESYAAIGARFGISADYANQIALRSGIRRRTTKTLAR